MRESEMNVISNAVIQDSPKKSRNLSIIKLLVREMRPKQWSKNLLVFAALIFSIDRFNLDMGLYAFIGFACFCIISSCVYILNDFVDREADKVHPTKKNRPIASGELNPYVALIFGLVIFLLVISFAVYFNNLFGIVLILYFLLNVAYSFKLKHIVILDVMTIASGFVLRAVGGALVIHVEMTPWFLICTMLLALFLGINKRRNELIVLEKDSSHHRRVLNSYSIQLIDQMNSVVTTATVVSYALFTFTSDRTIQLMWTIPLVLYGIFRYLYLIYVENEGGSPEKLLFRDKHLLLTVIIYALITIVVLLLFDK